MLGNLSTLEESGFVRREMRGSPVALMLKVLGQKWRIGALQQWLKVLGGAHEVKLC